MHLLQALPVCEGAGTVSGGGSRAPARQAARPGTLAAKIVHHPRTYEGSQPKENVFNSDGVIFVKNVFGKKIEMEIASVTKKNV